MRYITAKRFSVLFLILLLTGTLLTFAGAGKYAVSVHAESEPELFWDFKNEGEDILTLYKMNSMNVVIDAEDGFLHMVSENGPDEGGTGDPNITFSVDNLDADSYYWLKIKLRNYSDIDKFQLHFSTNYHSLDAATNTLFEISPNDTEFKTYVVDLKKANEDSLPISKEYTPTIVDEETLWTGSVTSIRLDFLFKDYPGGQVPTGTEMDIEYIAIFDSKEAAEAWEPEDVSDTTETPAQTPSDTSAETPDATTDVTPDATTGTEATTADTSAATPTPSSTDRPSTPASSLTSQAADSESDGISTGVIIGIIAVAVVVIAVIVIAVIKIKKKK